MPPVFDALVAMSAVAAALGGCDNGRKADANAKEGIAVTHTNNHVDYVEFAAKDLNAVKKFYGAAFGWEFRDWGPDYVSFSGSGLEGGVRGGETPVPGSTLVILYADDLEAAERRVVEAGGEIVERHEFPGGRRFHFRDPAGNVLAVWTVADQADRAAE